MRARLSREIRDLVYDELLTGESLEDMRKPMYDMFSAMPLLPSYAQIPHFLIPGLIDSDVIHEIVFHYYKTGKYPPLALPMHCNTFLRYDFYGAGTTAADVALSHVEIHYDDRSCSLVHAGERYGYDVCGDTFIAFLEHEHIWKDPSRFTLHIRVRHHTSPRFFLFEVCSTHESLKDIIKQVQDRGAKTGFAVFATMRDGSILSRDVKKHIDLFHAERYRKEARKIIMQLNIDLRTR